jgi:hypothetical protein
MQEPTPAEVLQDPTPAEVLQDPKPSAVSPQITIKDFTLGIGDHVTIVHVPKKRWYVAKVLGIKKKKVLLDFMAPSRGKWKWGQKDVGSFGTDSILTKVKTPTQPKNSTLYDINASDKKRTKDLFSALNL